MKLGSVLAQYSRDWLPDAYKKGVLDWVDRYHHQLITGFTRAREAIVLSEQERIRSAVQRSLNKFSVQIEAASEVARVAISILDLDEMLETVVILIRERFQLYYVAAYLLDEARETAFLRAGTGKAGRLMVEREHTLSVAEHKSLQQCVDLSQAVISNAHAGLTVRHSFLPDSSAEVLLPLISRDEVIGILLTQSDHPTGFLSQDVSAFQMIANQLATAIENAQLFADATRRADELAAAYERLQELDRMKNRFIQNVSHELRTPLAVIMGYTDLLHNHVLGKLSPEQMEATATIVRSAAALNELVNDIMAIIEVESRSARAELLDLSKISQQTLSDFDPLAKEAGITVRSEFAPSESIPLVLARHSYLRRVLTNLFTNAIKCTDSGGTITVKLWSESDSVFWQVQDTGIGIARDQQDRIFERFYQVEDPLRRTHSGTGLGLALVKEIVELYSGKIEVASEGEGRGSTFTVEMPAIPHDWPEGFA